MPEKDLLILLLLIIVPGTIFFAYHIGYGNGYVDGAIHTLHMMLEAEKDDINKK